MMKFCKVIFIQFFLLLIIKNKLFNVKALSIQNKSEIYSLDFRYRHNNFTFKNYLKYDDANNTEIIFAQLTFFENNPINQNILNVNHYSLSVFWYNNFTSSYFTNGLFYGVGQTKRFANY